MRERRHVAHHGPLATESLPERVPCRVVGPMLHRHGPLHDGADALPDPPRRLGLVVPDGREDQQEVGRGDVGDELVADERERVRPKAPRPVRSVFRIAPPAALLLQDRGGGLLEGGHAVVSALGCQRVAARAGQPAVGERLLARFGQRHQRIAAETEHPHLAANRQLLHPAPRARRIDVQVEPVPVGVAPGLADRAAEGGRERLVGMPAPALGGSPFPGQWLPERLPGEGRRRGCRWRSRLIRLGAKLEPSNGDDR